MWWRPRGHKWRHHMTHTRCVLDKQGYIRICACTRRRARVFTCTHAQACTHRPICNAYSFSTATVASRMRLSVTLFVHCFSCYIIIWFCGKKIEAGGSVAGIEFNQDKIMWNLDFVVVEVALRQVSLPLLRSSPIQCRSTNAPYSSPFTYHRRCIMLILQTLIDILKNSKNRNLGVWLQK
jgi:hypothetical protein